MNRRPFSLLALLPLAALTASLAAPGCARHDAPSVTLPGFQDLSSAPAKIQAAAEAVVRVQTAGSIATGSFVSATGLLLTNNHVLGVDVCPLEGCYVELAFDRQRGKPVAKAFPINVIPHAMDDGLDMALVQVYSAPGGAQLSTPSFLALEARDAGSLIGTRVTLVGHPEGHLKKWTAGEVIDSDGDWLWTSAYVLPGNSGSPVLDDGGKMVGILHRGPTGQDLYTSEGVNTYSIATASASLLAAMKAPLPAAMVSTAAATTEAALAANDVLYLNAHVATAPITGGTTSTVLSALATACDAGLARHDFRSPEDMGSALTPCYDAMNWIECRADATASPTGATCPTGSDAAAWSGRFLGLNAAQRALNGEYDLDAVSFGMASLATSRSDGMAAGQTELMKALGDAAAPLDMRIAVYLAAFGVTSYRGQDIPSYVTGYAKVPGYSLSATSVAEAAIWLVDNRMTSRSDALALLAQLYADPTVDVGTKLFVEDMQYEAGALGN